MSIAEEKKKLELKVPSETDFLEIIRNFVADVAGKYGFQQDSIDNIKLAVDEACTNVIKHAYKDAMKREDKDLDVVVEINCNSLCVVVIDNAGKYDPNRSEEPNMDKYIAELRVGGLGIYLMKKLMDEVDYQVEPGISTKVKMVKYLKSKDDS